jgi:HD-like signal output (HDOD) protein
MNDNSKLSGLLRELREKGHLPALDANVGTIYSLTTDPLTSAADLTAVILRDTALTSSVISTANSALYRPAEPVKTVSTAIIIMGYETVRSLAFGLGILKQLNQSAKNRNLYRLFACSYFAGLFAMGLGQQAGHENPEELRVQGILTELPRLLLANAFPEQYAKMEDRIVNGGKALRYACLEVFGVNYDDLVTEIARSWNLPASVTKSLQGEGKREPGLGLVHRANRIADMMFGNMPGGAAALAVEEKELQTLTKNADFRLTEFIVNTSTVDPNVDRFFKLNAEDVAMMVRIVEWGKVSSAQVAATLTYGAADEALEPKRTEDASAIIGNYLAEMILGVRRGVDLNRILLTGMEALYRCVRPDAVLLAFLDKQRQNLEGRSYLGLSATFRANQFKVSLSDVHSPIVRCLQQKKMVRTSTRTELPFPWLKDCSIDFILLAPVVVFGNSIGLCLMGRSSARPFAEQEETWGEAVAEQIAMAFERTR